MWQPFILIGLAGRWHYVRNNEVSPDTNYLRSLVLKNGWLLSVLLGLCDWFFSGFSFSFLQ